jgi:acyl-CoA synthetase (AMP-forming)/AMP-acid ligase II/aryl carrier-like protein
VALAQQLRQVVPDLFNLYGPTETTIWSAVHRVKPFGDTVPIGRPMANTQIYILDRNLQPVPAGVPGEIFIGGEGVARGYLNRPELTAEKFVRNPFGQSGPGVPPVPAGAADGTDSLALARSLGRRDAGPAFPRLYRTGDLGRWRANGEIEFLGRLDHQVKLRGHRLELGEVESLLGRHPTVRQAVVVAREDHPGDARLVAYVVAAPDAKPNATELRRFAREHLPEAMIPSAFVFLDALPLTPNGKVDRQALPAPEGRRPELETAYLAPRTELEQTVAGIWRDLLRVEQVGLRDNFFDLGGHSLLVVQMQARLRDALGRDVPVVKLFQYPTIGALAVFLSEREPAPRDKIRDRGQRKRAAIARHAGNGHEVMA